MLNPLVLLHSHLRVVYIRLELSVGKKKGFTIKNTAHIPLNLINNLKIFAVYFIAFLIQQDTYFACKMPSIGSTL